MRVNELFDLSGKVALVTGGSIGLGNYMAAALGEAGAAVVLAARKRDRCEAAAARLEQNGIRATAVVCDVTEPSRVDEMVHLTLERFGRLDILVNNAGISWKASPEDMTLGEWEKVLRANLSGTFLCAQAAGRVMIKQGGGSIINMASVAALVGSPSNVMDALAYSTSKGGVISFTRDLAVKWAPHGIRVNAIAPGWFPTHMSDVVIKNSEQFLRSGIPLGRFGGEDELKGVVVFLASQASSYVTGQVLPVDGGMSIM